jgi:hypothetical protein
MSIDTKKWELIFLLPNLGLHGSIGNDYIAIVSADDPRAVEISSSNELAKTFIQGFEDQFRRKVSPSLLLININGPDILRDIDTIVGFRNLFALTSIIKGYESKTKLSSLVMPIYSDYFDFYPISISRKNDGFITSSPAILGFDDETQLFRGQMSPALPNPDHVYARPEDQLFVLLERAWDRRYIKEKLNEWKTRKLFRSLEMAYHATTMPFKNHSTIYDYGSSASLWVSAFEILCHPRTGNVDFLSVLDLLGSYNWANKTVGKKAYKIKYYGSQFRVNLVQKLYKELYDTRNAFLHGNPVRPTRLLALKNKHKLSITSFAPLIYKVALLSFLVQFKDQDQRKRTDYQKEYLHKLNNEQSLCEAILKAKQ